MRPRFEQWIAVESGLGVGGAEPGRANADIIATNLGSLFVRGSPESFTYDTDGNLAADERWSYTWDAENRLVKMESLASTPAGSKRRLRPGEPTAVLVSNRTLPLHACRCWALCG